MLLIKKIAFFNCFSRFFIGILPWIATPPVLAQDSTGIAPLTTISDSLLAKSDTLKSINSLGLKSEIAAAAVDSSKLLVVVDTVKNVADTVQIQSPKIAIETPKIEKIEEKITQKTEPKTENLASNPAVAAKKPVEKKEKRVLPVMPPANFVILRSARQADAKTRNNGLVFINDTAKIRSLEALLDNNRAYAHHCGQAWSLSFWQSSSEKVDELSINPDCEQFEHNTKQINATVRELAAKIDGHGAPHYLYNFKLSSAFPPDLVESELAEHFQLLFMGGRFQHLPSVTFRVVQSTPLKEKVSDEELEKIVRRNRAKGRDRIEAVIEAVKSKFKVEATGKIQNPISGADDTAVEDAFDVTLKFNKDANLEAIATYINENGGNTTDKRIPEFYYIQVISPQKSLQVVREFVGEKFEYVRDVFDYPNKK